MTQESSMSRRQKFCDELKSAREYKNLDLVRISERSKISLDYLEKLEEGQWDFLPSAYIRSFLLTYVQIVGLEVDEVLREFDEIIEKPPVARSYVASIEDAVEGLGRKIKQNVEKGPESGESQTGMSFSLSSVFRQPVYIIIGAVFVSVVVFWVVFSPRKPQNDEVKEIPLSEVVSEHTKIIEGKGEEEEESGEEQPQTEQVPETVYQPPVTATPTLERLKLEVIPTDECYVRISSDSRNNVLDDVVLIRGLNRTYEADSLFVVVLGNAGGMKLVLNGTDLGELGETRRVVTVTIGPEGLRHLRRGVLRNVQPAQPEPVENQAEGEQVQDNTDEEIPPDEENTDNEEQQEIPPEDQPAIEPFDGESWNPEPDR